MTIAARIDGPSAAASSFERQAALAMLNILEDQDDDRAYLAQTHKATVNILEDFQEEKKALQPANRAMLNVLEDFDADRHMLSDMNRAVVNILEDLEQEKVQTAGLNARLEQRVEERTAELAGSEQRFRLLVESVKDYAIFMLDPDGNVATWNAGAQRFKGYQAAEIIGRHFSCFYPADAVAAGQPARELREAREHGRMEREGMRVRKDGSQFLADVVITAIHDDQGRLRGFSKITRDITDRKLAEKQAQEVIRREVLLKEIHHRVKNNLQVVSSLLYLQSCSTSDAKIADALQESRGRVASIALIHEKLYKSADLAKVDFASYVRELVADLFHTYAVNQANVTSTTKIDGVFLEVETAIPCGLIINELITNSFKHAFPAGRGGSVCVELALSGAGEFLLTVGDDGVGLPENFDWRKSKTLGLKLVRDLTRQLEGRVEVDGATGTNFTITFKDLKQSE